MADASKQRPVFFLWGTDCVDDPITNARKLSEAVKESATSLWLDWRAMRKEGMRQQGGGNLLALFSKQEKRNRDKVQANEAGATAESGGSGGSEQEAAVSASDQQAAGATSGDKKEDATSRKKRRVESDEKSGEEGLKGEEEQRSSD